MQGFYDNEDEPLLASHSGGLGLIQGQSMWDSWWKKWHKDQ
jgi:hypothetical protein